MSRGETLLIRYDEINKEFSYEIFSFQSSFKKYNNYAYACWNHRQIFIFGGYDNNMKKPVDRIWMLDIKEKEKIWKECEFKMPFAIRGAVAVVSESDSSIHVIGGDNDKGENLSTHYIMKLVKEYMVFIIHSFTN